MRRQQPSDARVPIRREESRTSSGGDEKSQEQKSKGRSTHVERQDNTLDRKSTGGERA